MHFSSRSSRNVDVTVVDVNTLDVSWDPPTYPNGDLTGYQVLVINRTKTTSTKVPPHLNQLIIDRGISKFHSTLISTSCSVVDA